MGGAIWIGTSGWVYPHWVGRFYPERLPEREWLRYYADRFPTVEINRSYYRLPTRAQFHAWFEQTAAHPRFCFAVKASRYITHMKKLRGTDEAVARLIEAARGLETRLGPFLYQLPPRWRADPDRLARFLASLPAGERAAFELRDPSWLRDDVLRLLDAAGAACVVAIGGGSSTPPEALGIGRFGYLRVHGGAYGIGLSDEELGYWARHLRAQAEAGREVFVYFNNDPEGHAVVDAARLRALLADVAVPPS